MRAILFILILVVVAGLILIGTGLIDINQTRPAAVPNVDATGRGVTASGGQTPAFDIETGSVAVGTTQRNVAVPSVEIRPASEANAQANVTQ
jgi:hypothetical protein